MKILLLGAGGQVGSHLEEALSPGNEVLAKGREQADLSDEVSLNSALAAAESDLVVNAAAYTGVDSAEEEQDIARRVNSVAPGIIAEHCANKGIPFIHYSTDYVFAGDLDRPYREDDPVKPLGVYGESKLAGEEAVLEAGGTGIVLRTSWVYSWRGKNFYRTMLRLASERDELNVVSDQVGAPTYAGSIAAATKTIAEMLVSPGQDSSGLAGIYHLSCGGCTSWHGFASKLLELNGRGDVRVNSITTAEFPTPAARPAWSVLDNSRLRETFDVELPHWEDALRMCISETRKE